MNRGDLPEQPLVLRFVPLVLLAIVVVAPLVLQDTWPDAHDGTRHLRLAEEFREAFFHGIAYPRWLPNSCGGYGYPTFVFYQPGYFYLHSVLSLVTPDSLTAGHLSLFVLLLVGGFGATLLAGRLARDALTGMFGGLLFMITPYLYVDLFVRGDMSELGAMMACPWPLYFLLRMKEEVEAARPSATLLGAAAVALAVVIYLHLFVAACFLPVFVIAGAILGVNGGSRRGAIIGRSLAASLLGLILSSPFWSGALLMRDSIRWENALAGYYGAWQHVVSFAQLFSNFWGSGSSVPGADDGMSFQLGLPHFLFASVGALLGRRQRILRLFYGLYLLCVLAMTPLATVLWERTAVRIIQFPWRLLSVIATLQVVCASGLHRLLARGSVARRLGVAFLLLAVASAWNYRQFGFVAGEDIRERVAWEREHRFQRMETYAATNEFAPHTADLRRLPGPKGERPDVELGSVGGSVALLAGSTRHRFGCAISTPVDQVVTLNQLYFPGWIVRLDGRRLSDEELAALVDPGGRIRVAVPAGGPHVLDARYGGPRGGLVRNLAIGLALAAFAVFFMGERRSRKAADPAIAHRRFDP